jgi:hypothetical protein
LIDSDLALFPGDADDAVSFIFPIISMQFNRLFKHEVKSISAMFMITFATNKTDRHNINEILLKMVLNTITQPRNKRYNVTIS